MADMGGDKGVEKNEISRNNSCESPTVVAAKSALPRSNSVFVFEQERRPPPLHWSRRSLPPAKRENRRKKKSASKDAPPAAAEAAIPRSKSVNFKQPAARRVRPPRSLSFASGSSARRARRAREGTDGEFGLREFYRRASIRSVLPVVQHIKETKSRKWTVAIFSLVAAILASLRGFTLSFSSGATLDLTGAADELPSSFLFSTTLISIFAVSASTNCHFSHERFWFT